MSGGFFSLFPLISIFFFFLALITSSRCFLVSGSTPACDSFVGVGVSRPNAYIYSGWFMFSTIVLIDSSILNNDDNPNDPSLEQLILDSLFVSSYIANETASTALWTDKDYSVWFPALNDQLEQLGAWDVTVNYDTGKMISIPITTNQNISTFSLVSNFILNSTRISEGNSAELLDAACQLDQIIGSPSLNNWVTVTSDPANILSTSDLFYSGSIWIVSQDDNGEINAQYITIIEQSYKTDCSVPWIICYHQTGDQNNYWMQAGNAIFNQNNYRYLLNRNVINNNHNYNNQQANWLKD